MKKIILLFAVLLFCGTAYSQYFAEKDFRRDTLIDNTSDTLCYDTLYSRYNNVFTIVQDTGATNIDSLKFEYYDAKLNNWVQVGVINMLTGTMGVATSSANNITIYKWNLINPNIIRVRLSHIVRISGRRVILYNRGVNTF